MDLPAVLEWLPARRSARGSGRAEYLRHRYGRHTNWLSVFLLDEAELGVTRDAIIAALAKEDIEARPVWKPMHMQPVFATCEHFGGAVTEDLFLRGVCLPSSSNLTAEQQARVIDAVRRTATGRHTY